MDICCGAGGVGGFGGTAREEGDGKCGGECAELVEDRGAVPEEDVGYSCGDGHERTTVAHYKKKKNKDINITFHYQKGTTKRSHSQAKKLVI